MADDAVPWMIGGGVQHSVEVARLLAYASFGGDEGIIGSKDLEVRETVPAGNQIRVFPGACSILNKGANKAYDAYATRFPFETLVDIAATGSGETRTDLIVARIENPFQAGEPWPEPSAASIADGTAIFRRIAVIPGIGAQTPAQAIASLGYSAIPLAKVVMPPVTSTVSQAFITDLRRLNTFRQFDDERIVSPTATRAFPTSSAWINWPSDIITSFEIPSWATSVSAFAELTGIAYSGTNPRGNLRIRCANAGVGELGAINMPAAASGDRATLLVGAPSIPLPAAVRGTSQQFIIEAQRVGTTADGAINADIYSMLRLQVKFKQARESNL